VTTAAQDSPLLRQDRAPRTRTLVEIFRTTVERAADEPAVDAGTGLLTYAELEQAADALALELNEHGVAQGTASGCE